MISSHKSLMELAVLVTSLALFGGGVSSSEALAADNQGAEIINIDFNGASPIPPPPDAIAPTYQGVGAAGGGTVFNGIVADSRDPDGVTRIGTLTVSGENLLDSLGSTTTVSFTVSPVTGDSVTTTTDPNAADALFGDYLAVWVDDTLPESVPGLYRGSADFTISGLGAAPYVNLYFYYREGAAQFVVPGATLTPFTANGIFTPANTMLFAKAPVTNGTVTGIMGAGAPVTVWEGLTIQKPPPHPVVKSASPSDGEVKANATVTVELEDYVTQVDTGSVQLLINGQTVTPTTSKPAGSSITTITYTPPVNWTPGSTNSYRIVFGDNSAPPVTQTNDFSFVVQNEALAAMTVNLDFTGARNVPAVRNPGPTFVGQGAAGGGNAWNGVLANSQLPDGTDDDNLTVTTNNLVNSIGGATTVGFSIAPVSGDNPSAGTDPTASAALFGDFIAVGTGAQMTGMADFTINGLGTAAVVDLYFYYGAGSFSIPGSSPTPFAGKGIFTSANTMFFAKIPVSNGSVSGTMGSGSLATLYGMTIQSPLPQPFVKSASPFGNEVLTNTPIVIELEDYITQVVPSSVQLLVNGQAVAAAVDKPAGSLITTVTYAPTNDWAPGLTNLFQVIFADNGTIPLVQSNSFSFVALNVPLAAATINLDFNGASPIPAPPDEIGPTYSGVGAAGGGRVFNGILADSRGPDEVRLDTLTVGGTNLLNSLGDTTSVSFTISPVTGDVWGPGTPTTDPTSSAALLGDYICIWVDNSLPETVPGVYRGRADFTIGGLGSVPYVDLYFYYGHPGMTGTFIPGATPTPFAGSGIFTPAGTMYYAKVPVTNGVVNGVMQTAGTIVLYGMTIQEALPQPFVKSASPTGLTRNPAGITVELEDNVTQVVPDSVQLLVNGDTVAATVSKPSGSTLTTVAYSPSTPWAQGSTNTVRIVYGNNAAPTVLQTNEFSFVVVDEAKAAVIINLDFNGASPIPAPPDDIGPTYDGAGAAGGWRVFNGIVADSRDPDGVTRIDTLRVGGTNLLNSLGDPTTASFTIYPVTGDAVGTGSDPAAPAALLGDYIAIWVDNNLEETVPGLYRGSADFSISGLGAVPYVDLYFYYGYAGGFFRDLSPTPFTGGGMFTSANTMYYQQVPVANGTVNGTMNTTGVIVLYGMTIQKSQAQLGRLNIDRQGNNIVLSWTGDGTLQFSDQVTGPWTDIAGALSPQTITPTEGQKFYRLRQ
ncbi:MAG: hypothetical protein M1608_13675 [Candidatus Omnitrophica bacterium]|nr:hypothetical protein [Candidatus Omnitrophota bacterium]